MPSPRIEYVRPGIDPTEIEYPPQGPGCGGCITFIVAIVAIFLMAGFLLSYARTQIKALPTVATAILLEMPTDTITPTITQTYTATATGTVTPAPTATKTQIPTKSPTPTPTLTITYISPPTKVLPVTATDNGTKALTVVTATQFGNVQHYYTPTPKPVKPIYYQNGFPDETPKAWPGAFSTSTPVG